MHPIAIALASEIDLDDYRQRVAQALFRRDFRRVVDLNVLTASTSEQELVGKCVNAVNENVFDLIILVSTSGNGLQILANKIPEIRAAPLPSREFIEEAVALNPNMCEVSATTQTPDQAAALIIELIGHLTK